jgi:uncharacterized protein (TIGR02246 family)
VSVAAGGTLAAVRADTKGVEDAILAVSAEMTTAAEAVDVDLLFGYMLDTETGSLIQDGNVMATRQEALERVRRNLQNISRIQYRWRRQYVTVLSPDAAVLTSEGESTATTTTGDTFTTPFAQTVVFVRKAGTWKAIHAHQSSPQRR